MVSQVLPDGSFKAIVYLNNAAGEVEHLKRLALIFDEIYYIHPQVYCLENASLIDSAGNFRVDFFRDCIPYDVMSFEDNLQKTLSVFEEAKIASGILASDEVLKTVRSEIAQIDHTDSAFQKLTSNAGPSGLRFTTQYLTGPEEGKQRDLVVIAPSLAVWDSLILTNTLYLANKECLFPVFLEARHRQEMEYRYNQYRQASRRLAETHPDLASPVNFPCQFGETTFAIFNNIWSHEMMTNKNPEEVIKYRNNMTSSRKKYVASLMEFANIAETNPWNQKTKTEVKKYLLKLEADLVTYREEANNIGKKMFDDLRVHSTEVIVKGIAGGIAGGLSGVLAPEISSWGLMLAGALMGSARTIAQSYKTWLDFRRAQKGHKESGVAYIAEFK